MHLPSGLPVSESPGGDNHRRFQGVQDPPVQTKAKVVLRPLRRRNSRGNRLKKKVEILEFESLDLHLPEHDLLAAYIERAVRDYIGPGTASIPLPQHDRRSAREFLFGRRSGPWTLIWCCEQISSDPKGLKEEIQKRVAMYKDAGIYNINGCLDD